MRRGLIFVACCALAAACAKRERARPKVALSAPITYETEHGTFASPLVRAEVNGRTTSLIVDTGATYHALLSSFAEQVGNIAPAQATDARDHTGQRIDVKAVDVKSMSIGAGIAARNTRFPVIPASESLQVRGIGGVLSPQALVPKGYFVVLDLDRNHLTAMTGSLTPADRAGPGQSLAPDGISACSSPDGPASRRYLVPTIVEGKTATFELDTGSGETHIFATSSLGRALQPRAIRGERRGAIGGEYQADVVHDVHVVVGEVARTVDVLLIPGGPPAECPFDGMLGMDILRSCIVALDSHGGVGRCMPRGG